MSTKKIFKVILLALSALMATAQSINQIAECDKNRDETE